MKRLLWIGATLGLSACGGAIVAVLGTIGAAGGTFFFDANVTTPQLDCSPAVSPCTNAPTISIQLKNVTNNDQLFATSFNVEVPNGANQSGNAACNQAQGTIAGDRLDLGACFRGRYTSVNRVLSDDGTKAMLFATFFPQLSTGMWVDIHGSGRTIKFKSDTEGCEYNGSTPTGNRVTLNQVDANLDTGVYNSITQFSIGTQLWSTGAYVGVSSMRLSGTPGTLEFERKRDSNPALVCV